MTGELKVIDEMNLLNKSKTIHYCRRIGLLSIAGVLFILPFHDTVIIRDIFFTVALLSFLTIIILKHGDGSRKNILPNKSLDILIIVSLVWGMIALLNAIDPGYSFSALIHKMAKQYLLYFLTFYFVNEISSDHDKLKWILFSLAIAAFIMSLYACYQFYQEPVSLSNRVSGLTGEVYRLAVFLALSIPVVLILVFVFQGWLRWMMILILLISNAVLFINLTRSAWIAVIIEALIFIVIFSNKYRKTLLIGIIAMVLCVIISAYMSIIPKELIIHGNKKHRIEAFKLSVEIIRKNPIMGIGYGKGTFSKYFPEVTVVKHSHNIFLNTAVELGIPGLVIFVSMLIVIIKAYLNAIRKELELSRKLFLSGILASIIGFLSLNLFDYMYHGWPGQMFWILIGFGYALINKREPSFEGEAQ